MHAALRPGGGVSDLEGLLRVGASVDSVDEHGRTVLHVACAAGEDEVVAWLLQRQHADFRIAAEGGRRPLHVAAAAGQVEACRLLLEAGAELHHFDDNGDTPATLARKAQHMDVVRLLLASLRRTSS